VIRYRARCAFARADTTTVIARATPANGCIPTESATTPAVPAPAMINRAERAFCRRLAKYSPPTRRTCISVPSHRGCRFRSIPGGAATFVLLSLTSLHGPQGPRPDGSCQWSLTRIVSPALLPVGQMNRNSK